MTPMSTKPTIITSRCLIFKSPFVLSSNLFLYIFCHYNVSFLFKSQSFFFFLVFFISSFFIVFFSIFKFFYSFFIFLWGICLVLFVWEFAGHQSFDSFQQRLLLNLLSPKIMYQINNIFFKIIFSSYSFVPLFFLSLCSILFVFLFFFKLFFIVFS